MLGLIKRPLKGLKMMGCKAPLLNTGFRRTKKMPIPEAVIYIPSLWIPSQTDLLTPLKDFVPRHLIHHLLALRTYIANLVAIHNGGSSTNELKSALEEYLSAFLGLTNNAKGLVESVEFKWTSLDVTTHVTFTSNSRFELLCVIYILAVLTLSEANELLIPKQPYGGFSQRTVSLDCQKDAIDQLLKAAGYFSFCVHHILAPLDPDIKEKLPAELQEGMLEALKIQSIGQATELQLGLAAESQTATLSVKRRLACEELAFFSQAYFSLSGCNLNNGNLKKHSSFIRWKYLEAKAAAYYYHGLIVDKGFEPQSQVSAVSCFVASQEHLSDSRKTCLSFSLASPVTRPTPPWGIMKNLQQKIPEIASKKLKAYGYLLAQQKVLNVLPDLPRFHLSLGPDDYELPKIDPAWNIMNWEFPLMALKERSFKDSKEQIHVAVEPQRLRRTDSCAIVPCMF